MYYQYWRRVRINGFSSISWFVVTSNGAAIVNFTNDFLFIAIIEVWCENFLRGCTKQLLKLLMCLLHWSFIYVSFKCAYFIEASSTQASNASSYLLMLWLNVVRMSSNISSLFCNRNRLTIIMVTLSFSVVWYVMCFTSCYGSSRIKCYGFTLCFWRWRPSEPPFLLHFLLPSHDLVNMACRCPNLVTEMPQLSDWDAPT